MKPRPVQLKTWAAILAVVLLTAACVRTDVTLESLLDEMTDYSAVAAGKFADAACSPSSRSRCMR